MKILVADDSKTSLFLISNALTKLGHEVIAVTSGQEAILEFQRHKPDLIILDVVMEGVGGFECAKKIREIDSNDWIPIIFISASGDDESISEAIDAGGDDYLTKPCSDITLAAKIKAMQRISDMRAKLCEATQQLYLLSSTDSLTGVYNRIQFKRSIKEVMIAADHYRHKMALLLIDLDNFKNINDTFGHHIGDLLLVEVAQRLRSCLRENDFIARLGGDEFSVILCEIEHEQQVELIAKKIIDLISHDYNLEHHSVRVGASVGISFYPSDDTNQDNLLFNADVAMYHAKANGRNNCQIFSKELNEKYRDQINLSNALKFALERNELFLTYQPIYDLQTGELSGAETLVCWDHPTFGSVSPSIFIPIAEETGQIIPIGSWILEQACIQCASWPLSSFKKFKFAINISSCQFVNDSFYDQVMNILNKYHIQPHLLEFELTETTMMTYTRGRLNDSIKKLHEGGIGISIDDFGTGYSSLSRLKHLPIDTLKIEKSFVQDSVNNQNGATIVNCLIALGKNLGLNVVAEGIETIDQLDFLIEKGCPQGQGYYLSKPLTTTKMTELISKELLKINKPVT